MKYRIEKYKRIFNDSKSRSAELNLQARPESLELFTNVMEEFSEKRVLDFYCGTGLNSILMVELGYRVIVSEASKEALMITSQRAKMYNYSLELAKLTGPFTVNLPDKAINGMIVLDIADSLKDEEIVQVITEAQRLLINGGFLFINFLPADPIPTKFKFNLTTDGIYTLLEGPESGNSIILRDNKRIESFFSNKFLLSDFNITKGGKRRILAKNI